MTRRCPHCGHAPVGWLATLRARARTPYRCPRCGGLSCTGMNALSLLSMFALALACGTLLRLAGRAGNRWSLMGTLALFVAGFIAIVLRTPLVSPQHYRRQRRLALAGALLLLVGLGAWWWQEGR